MTRKGKHAVIMRSIEEYKRLGIQKGQGLLQAKGSPAGFDGEIDRII